MNTTIKLLVLLAGAAVLIGFYGFFTGSVFHQQFFIVGIFLIIVQIWTQRYFDFDAERNETLYVIEVNSLRWLEIIFMLLGGCLFLLGIKDWIFESKITMLDLHELVIGLLLVSEGVLGTRLWAIRLDEEAIEGNLGRQYHLAWENVRKIEWLEKEKAIRFETLSNDHTDVLDENTHDTIFLNVIKEKHRDKFVKLVHNYAKTYNIPIV